MTASVTRRSTFAALSSDGKRVRHGVVRARWLAPDHPAMPPGTPVAIAFAFGRRFGSAVERNRAKRRLRAAFRDAGGDAFSGALLLSGTRQLLDRPYRALVEDVRACLRSLDRCLDNGKMGLARSTTLVAAYTGSS